MDQGIVPKAINFKELVKNSNTTLSLNVQSKIIQLINDEFTESEQRWYIANLYVYMNYHPTNDFPINLENVFKMIGFAHKGNAMKTIKNNFTKDEDYKLLIIPREKKQNAGRSEHEIMLNVDTFKNLCMIAKTDKGKAIRKYYVKLENIYNQIIKEEIEEKNQQLELERENTQKQLEEKQQEIDEKDKKLQILENKPKTHGFLSKKLKKKSCKYYGVTLSKRNGKYRAVLVHNKKQIHIGFFENEFDAAKEYNKKACELNESNNSKHKLNIF